MKYHFVLVDYLCVPIGGTLQAGDDVSEAEWAHFDALAPYELTDKATEVIERARALNLRLVGRMLGQVTGTQARHRSTGPRSTGARPTLTS